MTDAEPGGTLEILRAPFRFDTGIGYWTGEPDLELLTEALALVQPHPKVERRVTGAELHLRGEPGAVREQAAQLREAGLL